MLTVDKPCLIKIISSLEKKGKSDDAKILSVILIENLREEGEAGIYNKDILIKDDFAEKFDSILHEYPNSISCDIKKIHN